jgi:ABC-type enterochelin transport system permease subunit
MTRSDWSALISLAVAAAVLVAGFFQWWGITFDGKMRMRSWVKVLFVVLLVALCVAAALVVTQSLGDT